MVKEIITDYEQLSERSDEIDVRKEGSLVREITLALKDTIKEKGLNCLSAPQIGYQKRIFCINFKGDIRTFINPIITEVKGFGLAREKCDSLPGKEYIRPRHNEIQVMYQNPLGKAIAQKIVGMAAIVFQELVDHLDGLLLSDVGLEIDQLFDQATQEERDQVINAYLESLDLRRAELAKEIESTEQLKEISDAVKFIDSVRSGKTEVEFTSVTNTEGNK